MDVNNILSITFLCIFGLIPFSMAEVNESLARHKRNLIFTPRSSIVQLIVGTGVPVPLEGDIALTIGWVVKSAYLTPNNASVFTNPYVILQKRSIDSDGQVSRFDIYRFMESTFGILGGKGCVLRALCEATQTPFKASGIVGQILHIIFTPSSTDEKPNSVDDHEYLGAVHLGKNQQMDCGLLFPECKLSLLDILTMTS